MKRSIELSQKDISTNLPMQLASRTLASFNEENNYGCFTYVSQI